MDMDEVLKKAISKVVGEMDANEVFKKATNKLVEEIAEDAIIEWEGKNGVGLKYLNRQIRRVRKKKYPLKIIEELSDSIDKLKKNQIQERNIIIALGYLIFLTIDYCDSLNYDPNECAKIAIQYFA